MIASITLASMLTFGCVSPSASFSEGIRASHGAPSIAVSAIGMDTASSTDNGSLLMSGTPQAGMSKASGGGEASGDRKDGKQSGGNEATAGEKENGGKDGGEKSAMRTAADEAAAGGMIAAREGLPSVVSR